MRSPARILLSCPASLISVPCVFGLSPVLFGRHASGCTIELWHVRGRKVLSGCGSAIIPSTTRFYARHRSSRRPTTRSSEQRLAVGWFRVYIFSRPPLSLSLEALGDSASPFPRRMAPFPRSWSPFPPGTAPFPRGTAPFPRRFSSFPVRDACFPARDEYFPVRGECFPAPGGCFPAPGGCFPARDSTFSGRDECFPAWESTHSQPFGRVPAPNSNCDL